jgi:hypothetical protein
MNINFLNINHQALCPDGFTSIYLPIPNPEGRSRGSTSNAFYEIITLISKPEIDIIRKPQTKFVNMMLVN